MEKVGIGNPFRSSPGLEKVSKELQRLKISSQLPCGKSSMLIRSEYRYLEQILEARAKAKWAGVNPGEGPRSGRQLDYRVAGQPGSGV